MISELLNVKEMAKIFSVHEKVIYRWTRQGVFDKYLVKIGKSKTVRFDAEKIKAAIKEGKV